MGSNTPPSTRMRFRRAGAGKARCAPDRGSLAADGRADRAAQRRSDEPRRAARNHWGSSSASAFSAPCACPSAFISCQCPSNMITTSAESSHQNSRSTSPSADAALARKATVIASEMSSIIPGARRRSSDQAPVRKTAPP